MQDACCISILQITSARPPARPPVQDKFFGYFDGLGVNETEAWRPWTTDGKMRMGGYVVSYPGDFHYLTIRGSGHMVVRRHHHAYISQTNRSQDCCDTHTVFLFELRTRS